MVQQTHEAFSPLERVDLTEQTYQLLREKIVRNQLKPGTKISVDEVAEQLRISRSPITAALQHLANDGLVEIVPQRGTFVTALSPRDVAEIFEIRLMIELHAAQHIIEKQNAHRVLESALVPMTSMRQAMVNDDYGDYETFIQADRDFHLALVRHTDNRHMIDVYHKMNVHIQIARAHYLDSVEKARQAYIEHEGIVQAFQSGQLGQIQQVIRVHIRNVEERIIEILNQRGWSAEQNPRVSARNYPLHSA